MEINHPEGTNNVKQKGIRCDPANRNYLEERVRESRRPWAAEVAREKGKTRVKKNLLKLVKLSPKAKHWPKQYRIKLRFTFA